MRIRERLGLLLLATLLLVCGALFYRGQSATQRAIHQAEGALEILELDNLRHQIVLDRAPDSMPDGSVAESSDEFRRNDDAIAEISSITLLLLRKQIFFERLIMGGSVICGLFTLLIYFRRVRPTHRRDSD
jgi:hypothetical protein